ncbi:hypothetical protein CXQ80_18290 [Pseudomonas sp. 02C 26]|jgi:hypothetical protein|uniref:Uncharacterized protein n=1 Tax=Pseudomonas putida TaxID=303 RepID=A0A2S3WHK3_PSEPU|nr:hypothetical protein CXQ80_18290 [Pseudomonas sp. 02C 26]POF90437.1 hypothetical protein BGP80_21855 [Pseudomonas putida]RZI90911.1 MAG: hypothetical protein EOP15_02900 [Pseudomonas sp.]
MALFCMFMSITRHPAKQTLFDGFSSVEPALYTVPVQFRDMFRGKVGVHMAWPLHIPPGL